MRGFAILLAFNFLGVIGHDAGHIPIPAPVMGLILFTICLFLGVVRLEWVEQSAGFLLRHMLLFFAPVIVGVIAFFPELRAQWLAITVSLVVSTIVVMLVTGWTATALIRPHKHSSHEAQ
ncbi:MAG TPA: CidA/LrgA family protein [Tepidisphaeraceae bacterium]|jgi:holin-like protein|nr:CidA/LrgA family protein [Tepidisphaeraceae bacterium]